MDGDGSIHRFKWPLELPKTLAFPICKLNRRNKESALFLLFKWYLIHLHTCIELLKKKILLKFTQKQRHHLLVHCGGCQPCRTLSFRRHPALNHVSWWSSYNVYPFSYENLKHNIHSFIFFSFVIIIIVSESLHFLCHRLTKSLFVLSRVQNKRHLTEMMIRHGGSPPGHADNPDSNHARRRWIVK